MNELEFQKKSLMNFVLIFGLSLSFSSAGLLLLATYVFHWFGAPMKSFLLLFSIGSGCVGLIWGSLFYFIPLPKLYQSTEHMGDHITISTENRDDQKLK